MSERARFEKWAKRMGYADEFDVPLMEHAAWEGWQAALSTRKAYGYGIVDKDGKVGEVHSNRALAVIMSGSMDQDFPAGSPYRVVPLFYEDSEL
jgi:hypothetical protein